MFEEEPKQSPQKNFQEEVVDSIVKGDLYALKKCCIGSNDINRRLLPHKALKPIPKYNPEQRYINIRGPTILMYAILCEQDVIVEYILETKNPNVSVKVEGYNCLHLASMTKSPKCLQLLLQHEWIQENIDEPIDLLGTNAKEDEKTTALHVAVSNRRHANAILLLDRFPKPRWSHKKNKKTTENDENIDEEEKETIERHPASINQKSAAGSVPLFVAVYLHDYKMVRILLACNADPSIICSKNKTPIQLAEEIKKAYDEKKEKLQFQLPSQKELEIVDINKIVDALKNAESGEKKDSLEILKKEFAPELLINNDKYSSDSSDDEKNDDDDEKPAESVVLSPSEVAELKHLLKRINEIISKK